MTSLKIQYANEIAEAMAKKLNNDEFLSVFQKNASLKKDAGAALENYKKDLAIASDKASIDYAWNKHVETIAQEEGDTTEMVCLQAEKARELGIPGYAVPGCPTENCQDVEDIFTEDNCKEWDVVANFTLEHLAKIANTLDNKGFKSLANDIDEVMTKIAKKKCKYKTWKGKNEKPPKGAEHKAPKKWFDKMKKEIKEKNPDYSAKRINEIVGDIWDNELNDKKREEIVKRDK